MAIDSIVMGTTQIFFYFTLQYTPYLHWHQATKVVFQYHKRAYCIGLKTGTAK